MLVLIDNYDSFTWNLVHYFGRLGPEVRVFRNDETTPENILKLNPAGIVLSPGPCDPDRAGICLPMIAQAAERKLPVFGVCLGHQAIGQAFGGKVIRAPKPLHGKLSRIRHNNESVFAGLPQDFLATRYHSLTIDPATIPNVLTITARSEDGVIMGVAHRDLPIHGVQFHPESIASEHGLAMLANFVRYCGLPVNEKAVHEQAA
ncbi:aminodeoxychorismate/anthranilate synthase component II [uncultured Ferrovibrio sp.]|jgi:anthranilate synthase component 2|uniref:anthranilate synthase component II n=1 Tax=uncultured Ferrovibrio sp. TaxID=1576913 RepID=UPI0026078899|nr:aminodeoxychorismate/anthranilate synthase component II [uncultured Ferrovibrio sp.]